MTMDQESENFDFKKLLEEAKLDDLSLDFEKQFTALQRKAKLKRWLLGGIGLLLTSAVLLAVFHKEEPSKQLSSIKKDSLASSKSVAQEDKPLAPATISTTPKQNQPLSEQSPKQVLNQSKPEEPQGVLEEIKQILAPDVPQKRSESQPVSESTTTSTSPVAVVDVCKNSHITAKTKTIAACNSRQDGKLVLEEITGGTAPYFISVGDGNPYTESKTISNLAAKEHVLHIRDENGCYSQPIPFVVEEEICANDYDLIYSTERDNEVKIPVSVGHLILISDKRGNVLMQAKSESDVFYFDQFVKRNALRDGVYILLIHKGNDKVLKYEITVLP
jgi:hypothetical protein